MPKRALSRDNLRILYLAGPGDSAKVLRAFAEERDYDAIAHIAYSQQLFQVCKDLGAHLLTISVSPRKDDFSVGNLRAITIDDPLRGHGGINYHLANVRFAWILAEHVRRFDANVLVTATEPYPFLLEPIAMRGVHIIPALHALLLSAHRKPSVLQKGAVVLSKRIFGGVSSAILSHPGTAVEQVLELTGGRPSPIVEFLPLYPKGMFAKVPRPNPNAEVFRVLTVGRVERNKGVFDLVEIARRVREQKGNAIRFDVCGTGGALEEARQKVVELGLSETVTLHGWTEMEKLEQLWGESHIAVVPTTSGFVEGFNQVIVEAILAGRPVITSRACPALDFVRPCAIEVPVDDVTGYTRALLSLVESRERYAALQRRCAEVAVPFFDETQSFGTALRHILSDLITTGSVRPVAHPPTVI